MWRLSREGKETGDMKAVYVFCDSLGIGVG